MARAPCRASATIRAGARSASSTPGVGGLTVLHELLVQLPHEDFLYLGDTARFPYGERAAEELERFALEIAEELLAPAREAARRRLQLGDGGGAARAARAADARRRSASTCSASSSPEAVQAVAATRNGRDRPARHAGDGRERRLRARGRAPPTRTSTLVARRRARTSRRSSRAASPFDERVVDTVRGYCAPLREADVDTVILGCTHYPLVAPDAPAHARAAASSSSRSGARARAPGRARARRARARQPARRRGRLPLPVHRRRRGVPRARHALPADAARRRSSTSTLRRAEAARE